MDDRRRGLVAALLAALLLTLPGALAGCHDWIWDLGQPLEAPYYAFSVACRADRDCPDGTVCDPAAGHCTLRCLGNHECRLLADEPCAAPVCAPDVGLCRRRADCDGSAPAPAGGDTEVADVR